MTTLERYSNAACCFSGTVFALTENQFKGESTESNYWKSIKAYNSFMALTRALIFTQNAATVFDLTDYVVDPLVQQEVNLITSDDIQVVYLAPQTYADKTTLIKAIVDAINGGTFYTAQPSGETILLNTQRPSSIGITATLVVSIPFDIIDKKTSGGIDYSIATTNMPLFMTYADSDQNFYVGNNVSSANTTVSICTAAGESSLQSYTERSFQRGIAYNGVASVVYVGSNNITIVDSDPSSGTYLQSIGTLTSGGLLMSMQFNSFNSQLYSLAAVASSSPMSLRIFDSASALQTTILCGNYVTQSNFFNCIAISEDFVWVCSYETSEVFVLDGNSANPGTFNTIINTLTIDHPRSIKFFNDNLYVIYTAYNGTDARLAQCDLSLNVLQEVVIPYGSTGKGVDFTVLNQYLYVQGVNVVLVYNLNDFSLQATIPNIHVGEFYNAPDGSLWISNDATNKITIMDESITEFTYPLNFDDLSTSEFNCLTKQSQIDNLFCTIEKVCPCNNGYTTGSFGDNTQYILQGDAPNNYIDGNSNPISV